MQDAHASERNLEEERISVWAEDPNQARNLRVV